MQSLYCKKCWRTLLFSNWILHSLPLYSDIFTCNYRTCCLDQDQQASARQLKQTDMNVTINWQMYTSVRHTDIVRFILNYTWYCYRLAILWYKTIWQSKFVVTLNGKNSCLSVQPISAIFFWWKYSAIKTYTCKSISTRTFYQNPRR